MSMPPPDSKVTFIEGITTMGGSGSPSVKVSLIIKQLYIFTEWIKHAYLFLQC